MITSMSRSELYKTIVGYDNPFNTSNNSTSAKTAEKKEITSIPENAIKVKDMPVYKDLSSEGNRDSFVFSETISYKTYDLGTIPIDGEVIDLFEDMPYEATEAIDFMDPHLQGALRDGFDYGLPTKERIAEYYGAMAKRLDGAYAEGKFTKDEYDELNEMILNQIEKQTTITENKTAFYALGKKRYSLPPEAVAEIVKREKTLSPEERLAEREEEIRAYAERYCKIDRAALMKLFNSIRYGR